MSENKNNKTKSNSKSKSIYLPLLAMKGLVVFPGMVVHFDISLKESIEAIKNAIETGERRIFLVAQNEEEGDNLNNSDNDNYHNDYDDDDDDNNIGKPIYEVGTIAEVRQVLETSDHTTRVLVEGIARAKLIGISSDETFLTCMVTPLRGVLTRISIDEETALVRMLLEAFKRYCLLVPRMPNELYEIILNERKLSKLFENIVFNIFLKPCDKQRLLELNSLKKRGTALLEILESEIHVSELELELRQKTQDSIEKFQKESYLREQMHVISQQLGDYDDSDPKTEFIAYTDSITALKFPEEIERKLLKEAERLLKSASSSQDAATIRTYLDIVIDMPWGEFSQEEIDIKKATHQLEIDHFGLEKVKERILETFAVRKLNPDIKGQILCLSGPPGVGKTSIGKSIAKALGRKFARISLGGVDDEAEIRGHRKTYVGAVPGKIADTLKTIGVMNPVILLDEIDKMGDSRKGDPASAMLEVLDPEQNGAFVDSYLEIPIDLSRVVFIATANDIAQIPAPLLDRMEVIELSSYNAVEKWNIAKKHLIPKQLKEHGLTPKDMSIASKSLSIIIESYTKEAGVRKLERKIAAICRKVAKEIVINIENKVNANDERPKIKITPETLSDYLGPKKYVQDSIPRTNEIGIVNGLAWTSVGGVLLPLEAVFMEGTGKIEVTGSLGDVMAESSKIAISLVRTLSKKYNFDPDFYKTYDIHINAPEGAVPKNGPSAGITMVVALVSALTGIPVNRKVAMTGEITLHGKVLPIGGLKEKSIAAYKAGVKTVIIPKENEPDIDEIDDTVKNALTFIAVDNIHTVLEVALSKRISVIDGARLTSPPKKEKGLDNSNTGVKLPKPIKPREKQIH